MEDDRLDVDIGVAADIEAAQSPPPTLKQPKKRFVGRRAATEAAAKDASGNIENSGAIQSAYMYGWVIGSSLIPIS